MAVLRSRGLLIPLGLALSISMAVAWSDYTLADTARDAAQRITRSYGARTSLTFQGHWGFQYYMEQKGAVAWDPGKSFAAPVAMAVPENNTNMDSGVVGRGVLIEMIQISPAQYLSTMNSKVRAGFYSSVRGALPYAFCEVPDERYIVVELP